MSTEQLDFEAFNAALQKLIEAPSPEAAIRVIQQHPEELLTEQSEKYLNLVINTARDQGDKEEAQLLEERRDFLQAVKQAKHQAKQFSTPSILYAIFQFLWLAIKAYIAEKRFSKKWNLQALDKAVAAWESVLNHPTFINMQKNSSLEFYFRDILIQALNNSGCIYMHRYKAKGACKDLESAIACWELAKKYVSRRSPGRLYYTTTRLLYSFNNLANGLCERYKLKEEFQDLERSIQIHRQACQLTPKNSSDLPARLGNLGSALSERHRCKNQLEDLEEVIQLYQQAYKLTSTNSDDFPGYLSNLGNAFLARARLKKSLEEAKQDLEEAIRIHRQVCQLIAPHSLNLPQYFHNLGNVLYTRYFYSNEQADLSEAITAYQQAIQKGLIVAIEVSLSSARSWLDWAFMHKSWREVEQAYEYAYQASEKLFQIQLLRQDKESWLKETQGLATHAAYALAKMNKLTDAVVTLERGLAQLLSEALARDRADLEQLKVIGYGDLYDRYQQAVEDWHNAQHVKPEDVDSHLQAAREELDKTIAAIRQVNSYADFLTAPEFADIVAAVKDCALVYLATTKAGGLALIVYEGGKITPVWLPELTEATLQQMLGNMEASYSLNSIESTIHLLCKIVMAPVIKALPKYAKITLIPVGRLGLLPLHAAWTEDATAPTGKRYALDELTISYAPNARALTEARNIANRVLPDTLLAVDEPQHDDGVDPLPHSEYGVKMVVSTFPQPQQAKILRKMAATHEALLEALPNCTVLHFSGHGKANLTEPLFSCLVMARKDFVTVQDLLNLRLKKGVRLVTLSACETGVLGMPLPDEVVSLPTGLLQAGVAGVVASLWSVNEYQCPKCDFTWSRNDIRNAVPKCPTHKMPLIEVE